MRAPPEAEIITSGVFVSPGFFDGASDDFPNHCSHAAADESVFHRTHDDRTAVQFAFGVDDGVGEFGVGLGPLEAGGIGFQVDEFQGIGGDQVVVEDVVLIVVEQLGEAAARVDAKMLVALGTNVEVVFKVFFPDDLAAAVTLHPQAFGANFLFARAVQLTGLAFEPSHC